MCYSTKLNTLEINPVDLMEDDLGLWSGVTQRREVKGIQVRQMILEALERTKFMGEFAIIFKL